MSGTKKTYNLGSKNYFEFFNIEVRQGLSIRSLSTHYKKVASILKQDNSFIGITRLAFAERAFHALSNPIDRARYILEMRGYPVNFHSDVQVEHVDLVHGWNARLEDITDEVSVDEFIEDLKYQSDFIIQEIESNIDTHQNYATARGLVIRFHELTYVYELAKEKKRKMQDGIVFVAF